MTRRNNFFEGCCWFKFNNLGLALGMALTFYTSMAKGLKLKVRKFWGLIPTFVEVTGGKVVGDLFAPPPLSLNLNRVKIQAIHMKLFMISDKISPVDWKFFTKLWKYFTWDILIIRKCFIRTYLVVAKHATK